MADFPRLKTGAIAQYPAERSRLRSTQVSRFIDGHEQRFAQYGSELKRWLIRLEQLDETELAELESFFVDQGGRNGHFSFTDPWDGTVFPDCSFEDDVFVPVLEDIGGAEVSVVVKENR